MPQPPLNRQREGESVCKVYKLQPYLQLAGCVYPCRNFFQYLFHHCFSVSVTRDVIVATKSYNMIHLEDIHRRSNDFFTRMPFLFLIEYPKQLYVLRNVCCTARYPLNQIPPIGAS